jgi:[ribosomal protein S5]-alanine N-acetyltransferase
MTLSLSRLRIRALTISDTHDFHHYRSNPEVMRFQGFDVMSEMQAKSFIQKNATKNFGTPGIWVQYGIEELKSGKLIGDCALKADELNSRIAQIGITISHRYQNNGYAKEAMKGLLKFLFEEIDIHRVVEIVDTENIASINLLRSLGFKQEGHFIENIFFKRKWGSGLQFAMLKQEWLSYCH